MSVGRSYYLLSLVVTLLVIGLLGQASAISNQFDFVISNIIYQSSIGQNGANVGYTVTATSNSNPVSSLSCTPSSGGLFPVGDTPVICTATDNQGNSASHSFIVSVSGTDSIPPTIIPPVNVTATGTGTLTNVTLGNATVSDNADSAPIATNDAPQKGFPVGTTMVNWTATDHSGNSVKAVQQVTLGPPAPLTTNASPHGGIYNSVQSVSLSSTDPATIYYTTDGSNPTNLSAIYKNPILLSASTVLKFFGGDAAGNTGPLKTENYTIDTISPVITLRGFTPVTISQGSAYTDAGATALDDHDGNITSSIVTSNPVNTSLIGNYNITYNVHDTAGKYATQVIRTIKVIHTGSPIVYMQDTTASAGLSTYSGRPVHAEYVNSSSVLVGKQIDAITLKLERIGSPTGTAIIGIFNSDLSVKKQFGTRDVSTLTGSYTDYTFSLSSSDQPYLIKQGDRIGIKFTGGNSTSYVATMTDRANAFDGANSYRTYYTTLWSNFPAEDLYMTLKLANVTPQLSDTTPPGITLRGSNQITIQSGTTYLDAGATALDNVDGNITSSIITYNPVNTSILGTYTVTYNVHDAAGNYATQVTRNVKVIDNIPPTVAITPLGTLYNSTQSVVLSASEPATIYYTTDGTTPTTSSQVYNNPVTVSSNKTFNFFAKDIAGNSGTRVTKSYVIDTLSPVITLRGTASVEAEFGSTYVDAGATALDNVDGNITSSIITSNPVNTSVFGTYTLTYDVHDAAGNYASQVTRTVNVVDTTPPVITLRGSNPVTVQVGTTYVDAGANAIDNHDGNITSSIVTSNPVNTSILGNYTVTYDVQDSSGNVASTVARTVRVIHTGSPLIYMQDTTASQGQPTFIGRQIHAEYVSGPSALVGKQIDTITVRLLKVGSPTGTFQVGVFGQDLSVKKLFATVNTSTLSNFFWKDYTFSLATTDTPYLIQPGDRIGIKYTGGNGKNTVNIMTDQNNKDPFNGVSSYYMFYDNSWKIQQDHDLYMTLKLANTYP